MKYPSAEEIENATIDQVIRWNRFLPSPSSAEEIQLLNQVVERFHWFHDNDAGFPAASKRVGWDK